MNGLEALKRIRQETAPNTYCKDFDKEECCNTIEKELKALEIIKRTALKLVSLEDETTICPKGGYAFYDGELYQYEKLTKDEFDLLKEVMK